MSRYRSLVKEGVVKRGEISLKNDVILMSISVDNLRLNPSWPKYRATILYRKIHRMWQTCKQQNALSTSALGYFLSPSTTENGLRLSEALFQKSTFQISQMKTSHLSWAHAISVRSIGVHFCFSGLIRQSDAVDSYSTNVAAVC